MIMPASAWVKSSFSRPAAACWNMARAFSGFPAAWYARARFSIVWMVYGW